MLRRIQYAVLLLWGVHCMAYTLSPALLSISFILLCIPGLLMAFKTDISKNMQMLMLLFAAFYLSSALSYFNSENSQEALRKLILKLPLLCFPVLYITLRLLRPGHWIAMGLTWMYAMYLPGIVSVYNYLINKTLFDRLILESKPLPVEFGYGIYHIQYSVLLAASVLLGVYLLTARVLKGADPFARVLTGLLTAANFTILHILSARTGLLAMYAGMAVMLIPYFGKLKRSTRMAALTAVLLIPVLLCSLSSSLRNRLINTYNDLQVVLQGKDANDYSFAMRVQAWKNAAGLIAVHPVSGVGIGDADHELYTHYTEQYPFIKPYNRKNPHVQILETAVQSGLIAALLFLGVLASVFWIRQKPYPLPAAMAMLLLLASCFESILERQATVVGFSVLLAFSLSALHMRMQAEEPV